MTAEERVASYGLADIGVAGYMTAGYHSGELLVQVGAYYTPSVADIAVAGMTVAGLEEGLTNLRYVDKGSLQLSEEQGGVGEASFRLKTTRDRRPQDGDLVVVAIGSLFDPLFSGYITRAPETKGPGDKYLYDCTAKGLARDLGKRLIAATYRGQYAGDILTDILATYTPQFKTAPYIARGVYIEEIAFDYVSPLDAAQELAARSYYTFYVDPLRYAHFARATADTAAWQVGESGQPYTALRVESDSEQMKNRVLVLYTELEARVETFAGDGATTVWTLSRAPYAVTGMTVDGLAVTFGTRYSEDNAAHDFSFDARTGDVHTIAHATLTAGQQLAVTYTANVPAMLAVNHAASQSARRSLEGGDGVYDMLVDYNEQIFRLADAQAAAEAILDADAWPHYQAAYERVDDVFGFETARLRVGQQQSITARGWNLTLTIARVTTSVSGVGANGFVKMRQAVELGPVSSGLGALFRDVARARANATPERILEVEV